MTLLPVIPSIPEEITGFITKAAKGANKAARNPPSRFFTSCFTASVTPSINTPESSKNFTILITSSISSFKIRKVNPFPPLTLPFPFILLLQLHLKLNFLLIQENCF